MMNKYTAKPELKILRRNLFVGLCSVAFIAGAIFEFVMWIS